MGAGKGESHNGESFHGWCLRIRKQYSNTHYEQKFHFVGDDGRKPSYKLMHYMRMRTVMSPTLTQRLMEIRCMGFRRS